MNSVQIRSYFWSVFSCNQSEYRKIRTRNNSLFGNMGQRTPLLRQIIGSAKNKVNSKGFFGLVWGFQNPSDGPDNTRSFLEVAVLKYFKGSIIVGNSQSVRSTARKFTLKQLCVRQIFFYFYIFFDMINESLPSKYLSTGSSIRRLPVFQNVLSTEFFWSVFSRIWIE